MDKAVQINTDEECDVVNNVLKPLGKEMFTREPKCNTSSMEKMTFKVLGLLNFSEANIYPLTCSI